MYKRPIMNGSVHKMAAAALRFLGCLWKGFRQFFEQLVDLY